MLIHGADEESDDPEKLAKMPWYMVVIHVAVDVGTTLYPVICLFVERQSCIEDYADDGIRAYKVEQDLYQEHRQRIENVHVHLMRSQIPAMTLSKLDDTEDAASDDDNGRDGKKFVLP